MSIDLSKIQLSSKTSSNKVILEGDGDISVAALSGVGETYGIATIPHGYGSDNLLYQVGATTDTVGASDQTMLPWESSDGRLVQFAYIDSTNLYIICISSDSSGFGSPARTVSYTYRILIP